MYIKTLSPDVIVAEGFSHSYIETDLPEDQKIELEQKVINWLIDQIKLGNA